MDRRPTFVGKHIVFVVNVDWFFESHRLPLALRLLDSGAAVSLVTAATGRTQALSRHGIRVEPVPLSRSERSPRELFSFSAHLRSLFEELRPSLVHNVTVKPVLAGSLAARAFDRRLPVINAISGFGHLLSDPEAGRVVPRVASLAYRIALRAPVRTRVIVQNEEAVSVLLSRRLARPADVRLIPGMGVDIDRFRPPRAPRSSAPIVMLASRMIRSKGILEFIEAATLVEDRFPDARFVLVGAPDPGNPLSIDASELRAMADECGVEWWGETADMASTLREADVFVLPTYHEGLPKVLLEAAASGLPIVSSDIAGCRQVVRDGREALLIPPRSATAIAEAVGRLLGQPELSRRLGDAARARVVSEFTVGHAVEAHLNVYAELLARGHPSP